MTDETQLKGSAIIYWYDIEKVAPPLGRCVAFLAKNDDIVPGTVCDAPTGKRVKVYARDGKTVDVALSLFKGWNPLFDEYGHI